ncbi:MAG: hypothetical protein MIN69_03230 [Methylorubrum extorquens]|jgi:hypothetical protein
MRIERRPAATDRQDLPERRFLERGLTECQIRETRNVVEDRFVETAPLPFVEVRDAVLVDVLNLEAVIERRRVPLVGGEHSVDQAAV